MATYNLIFYDSGIPSSVLLMQEYYYKNVAEGSSLTVKDVNGVSNANLATYIGTLTQIYTEIMVASACEATADTTPTATLNCGDQYSLYGLLISDSQGTLSDEIANATTYTAHTIGDSGITDWTTNSLVGTPDSPTHIVLTGGTGASQLSVIKSNTTTVATVYGDFYAVPDSTTDFKVLTGAKLFLVGQAQAQSATVTKNRAELGWEAIYPDITLPVINSYFAGVPGYALFTGTSDSFGAKTLVDSALGASTDLWAGYFVVLYSHSTNSWQYGEIASNTSTTLTLTANWTLGTPTGTGTYKIYAREVDCLNDTYFQMWMMTNMNAANSNSTHLANLTKLIDQNGALANGTAYKQTSQDLGYLAECLATGKTYLEYITGGWTLVDPS